MLLTKIKSLIIGCVSIMLLCGLFVLPANAQSLDNAAEGIQISPALIELNATRGKTYNLNLTIMNVTNSDLIYDAMVDDFNSTSETGSPHIITDNTLPPTSSVVTWVAGIPEFTLHSKQSKSVVAQVTIPANAEPGGHYGIIRFSCKAPNLSDNGVGLSASAGVLLLIRVDGAITEKADLASFYSTQNDKQSFFFENGPINFVTRIQNTGNIHIKPVGSIEVHDMFGGLTATLPVNSDQSNVLPNSIRRFESQFNEDWLFGRYTANLTLGYGTTGQAITSTISFWVIPYKIVLVGLLALATLIFIFSRLIKVYNKHIIEMSKKENASKNKKSTKEKHR
jgi:hypothetical protein